VSVEEAMVHSDSPSNLHWLLSNRPKNTGPEGDSPSSPGSQQSPGDISSIKLNLDALG